MMNNNNIFILTGDINSGKSSYISSIISNEKYTKIPFKGILTPSEFLSDSIKNYYLYDIEKKTKLFFAGEKEFNESYIFGRFYFSKTAVKYGNEILSGLRNTDSFVIIDEIGPMELTGSGYDKGFKEILISPPEYMLIVIRKNFISKICEHYRIKDYSIITVGENPDKWYPIL